MSLSHYVVAPVAGSVDVKLRCHIDGGGCKSATVTIDGSVTLRTLAEEVLPNATDEQQPHIWESVRLVSLEPLDNIRYNYGSSAANVILDAPNASDAVVYAGEEIQFS